MAVRKDLLPPLIPENTRFFIKFNQNGRSEPFPESLAASKGL